MTTKDKHVLQFWFTKTCEVITQKGREVSSGEVARHVGQTRATAKRYLNRLAGEGALSETRVVFKNGTEGLVYGHID